jgi:hypothetical protein
VKALGVDAARIRISELLVPNQVTTKNYRISTIATCCSDSPYAVDPKWFTSITNARSSRR